MNLQLALDRLSWDGCFHVAEKVREWVDWVEVGTGVIKTYGMSIVTAMKKAYPEKVIVADMKTCDAGADETRLALDAGADVTTVMAFSAEKTIADALEVAVQYRKKVMVDLLGVTDGERLTILDQLGVTLISLHQGKDMQKDGAAGHEYFPLTAQFPSMAVAVAGGIDEHRLPKIITTKPSTVIVGSAITAADDPRQVAEKLKRMMPLD